MHTRVLLLASVAITAIQGFAFKETYPVAGSVPAPKPEWLALIKNVNITNAPVYKVAANAGPQAPKDGSDPYCDWTFTGCVRETDLYQCPKGQWAPTYDDGPTDFSPKLYDYLDQHKLKITLFMVGGQVVKFPELTQRAYTTGHELAMHTWSHSYMTSLTNEQIVAELKWNELAIKEVTGVSPRFFRPPYGDIDDRVRDVAKALGFVPVIWNHDTDDWRASEDKTFLPSWIDGNVTQWAGEAATATTGGISLSHDLYNITVDAALRYLPSLEKAYTITSVGKCTNQQVYKEIPNNSTATTNSTASASASAAGKASASAANAQSDKSSSAASRATIGSALLVVAAASLSVLL